ncbi:MAG: prepilin-type N-terminal cleavage/methylation domain-containing protein [Desulfobacteraceae bacterium]|nr:MAG: prepilin-type N-terminal cleavage/methylation domain-containing protein [Desulfobacteraceae bacterium]
MKNSKNLKEQGGQAGFTLLEVVVAISVLTVGLLAVASMQISGINGNKLGSTLTEGTTIAEDRLEKLIALPYVDVKSSTSPQQYGHYSVSWTVTEGSPLPNTKRVSITVSWNDKGTIRQTVLGRVKNMY